MSRNQFLRAVLLAGVVVLAACGRSGTESTPVSGPQASGGAASAPAVSVSVVIAARRNFPIRVTATGTVTPLSSVDVKPQVSSVVTQVHVREGQFVRSGELLFTLDARGDEANLGKAQAQMARDLATLADARRQLDRNRDLLGRGFISQGAVDTAQANADAQQAAQQADQAEIDAVRVSLSYARIRAPGAGRVGAIAVYPGTSVSANGPALVTITQLDPIAVAFSLPQRDLPDALRLLPAGAGGGDVSASLPDRRGDRQGKLQFVDNQIDAASGTVRVKAAFDNKDHALWPGAFVDVALRVRTLRDVIVIPQAAIVQGPRGSAVFIVGGDKRAVLRPVAVLASAGQEAVVSGIESGEKVVLDGRENLRSGSPVIVRDGGSQVGAPAASAASPVKAMP